MRRLSNAPGIPSACRLLAAPAARRRRKRLRPRLLVPSPAEPSPWLFGDWNGERTRLKDRGIDFQFGYTGEAA